MYLKEMQIRNFRNFHKAKFVFQKGVNVIIGENDSGKTNALQAIRLILDRRLNWYEKEITEEMFSDYLKNWKGHVIVISLRFGELDISNEEQAMLRYITGSDKNEGSLTWFCIPDTITRKKIEKASMEKKLSDVLDSLSIDNYVSFVTCGSDIDYLNDDEYEKIVGKIEEGYSNLKEKLDDKIYGYVGSEKHNNIEFIRKQLVDFTYIDALRDAVYDMKQKFNPLMTMLRQLEPRVKESDKEKVRDLVKNINGAIGGVEEVSALGKRINRKIIESVGNTYSLDIVLKSEVSDDIKEIFRNLKLKSNTMKGFDLDSLGLGSTNIIYIALKLLEYSFIRELDEIQAKYLLLLFEEPEAHLHKHIQMSLFDKTGINADEGVQVIMTTHSDNISAASKISKMNILKKENGYSRVIQPALGLHENDVRHIERYLDSKRSELLFSKSVILVEGDAEEILIPVMCKKCLGLTLDELGISLINIGSVGFKNIYQLFNPLRINKRCAVITDMDEPIKPIGAGSQDNAYERGKSRRSELEKEHEGNIWVDGFFSKHTFEVDMVKGNEGYLKKLIEKTYVDKKAIEEKKSSIDSADVTKYGDVALKLADKNGKGWNAVLLSEIIDAKFYIPQYILDAIAFAAREELKNVNYIHTILEYYGKVFSDVSIIEGLNTSEKIDYKEMVKDAKEQNTSSIRFLNTWLGVNG